MDNEFKKINISTWSIAKTILMIVACIVLYILSDIIGLIFVAMFLSAAITPAVEWFKKKKVPKPLGVLIIYILVFFVISVVIGFLVPPITNQINEISNKFPEYYNKTIEGFEKIQGENGNGSNNSISNLFETVSGNGAGSLISSLFGFASSIFGGVIFFVIVLVMVFYMSVQENAVQKIVNSFVPQKHEEDIICLLSRIQDKLGVWLRNVLLLGVIIATMVFVAQLFFLPQYALVLALFAGLMEFIPYVGPTLAAAPAVFLAFGVGSWPLVIIIVILYVVIQQLENHLIVPQVMKRAVGLNPIVSIIAMMIGARLGGKLLGIGTLGSVVGVFLAIPVAITLFETIDYFTNLKKGRKQCKIDANK